LSRRFNIRTIPVFENDNPVQIFYFSVSLRGKAEKGLNKHIDIPVMSDTDIHGALIRQRQPFLAEISHPLSDSPGVIDDLLGDMPAEPVSKKIGNAKIVSQKFGGIPDIVRAQRIFDNGVLRCTTRGNIAFVDQISGFNTAADKTGKKMKMQSPR